MNEHETDIQTVSRNWAKSIPLEQLISALYKLCKGYQGMACGSIYGKTVEVDIEFKTLYSLTMFAELVKDLYGLDSDIRDTDTVDSIHKPAVLTIIVPNTL